MFRLGAALAALVVACASPAASTTQKAADLGAPDLGTGAGGFGVHAALAASSTSGLFSGATDAVPSSDGRTIYFTALTFAGDGAVYAVAAVGGPVSLVASGAPLGKQPLGIALAADDQRLVVADPSVGLVALTTKGAVTGVAPGSADMRPRGVVWPGLPSVEMAWTGVSPGDGAPAVFVEGANGTVTVAAHGAPLSNPVSLAADASGALYIGDVDGPDSKGALRRLGTDGTLATVATDVALGFPPGLAPGRAGDAHVLVSGRTYGHAALFALDPVTHGFTIDDAALLTNSEAAGLHKAVAVDVWAWCGGKSDGSTAVYAITLQ